MTIDVKTVLLHNGEKLTYRERAGTEPPLLLIHGNMASSELWEPLLEHEGITQRIIAADMRGYGESSYYHPVGDMKDFSADLYDFTEQLGLNDVMIMGWSNGGGIAMQFAADYPNRVRKLILLASISTRGYAAVNADGDRLQTKEQIAKDPGLAMTFQANQEQNQDYFEQALNYLLFNNHQPDAAIRTNYIKACMKQQNMIDVADAANRFNISSSSNGLTNGTGELNRIQCPVLVIWGVQDLITTQQMTGEILEDFASHGKSVQYITLDAGHFPLIDDLYGLVASVNSFIALP
ncbi:intracellular short-chain-length polyhydroxyalkanoate depolymerase [Paenibacillus glucanolyticus]|uniref:intracellular short-chain-length polyhydroxyalkanoate depolymerase n=1 Tax=Paenibacillus glucanolyticus TaxID=59843 RepID=UPI00128E8A5C|nr:alpha/beta hydrolase [Paenibacillus glucanolyticus]MPY17608.1 alpha/beta hydrolase [Paenibacillus glucanolyticus]